MVALEGVGFGLFVTLVGGVLVGFASTFSAVHARVIAVEPEGDARTRDGVRTLFCRGAGVVVAGFGVVIVLVSLAS